ncbi:TetR/AcrR family transcriptional regulator [Nocardioides carbamazepini]|uniref:TetR/AcrR family transcriptional regulator n=1 Tax=Nocardioides carbamazepini TaxID=2854259 RepID=UPI00214A86C1|nr:TetR/AcrR family transcriptional regulator [Nocardioides carbamazepini]MCR1785242.1 TetR/AcrR family transcriptional regulator [Nocardioides carbamazepini]
MAGARIPLTPERIVGAAVAVADRSGIGAVSMRNVGKELGVEAMSLYHHIANKEALLDALVDWVFDGIDLPETDEAWRPALRRRSLSARTRLAAHPWGVGLIESRRTPGAALLRHLDTVLGALRRGGFSVADAAHAFSVVDAYVYGFVITEVNLPFETPGEVEDVASGIAEAMPDGAYPHLAELITEHALRPDYDYRAEFTFGLDLILDGLARLVEGGGSAV